ncbi:MATE family efflux transporter [Pseudogemmobacter sonorensis]|uniref:MATE family efflux transporter n=1 Tax=Pseudogemmobacter sonorensis TaxID=2989681 RepID=UPI0036A1831A
MQDITHRRVLGIALPILVSNATIPLLGLVDTAVVGRLGAAAPIGAVGMGGVILTTFYLLFSFLRMGTSGLAAQAHGRADPAETAMVLHRALLIAAVSGLALILLQIPILAGAFAVSPASAEVEELARAYVSIRIWGAPAVIGLYAVTGWLIALERARAVLMLQLWINAINIALDVGFVIGLGWGVPGVAAATLIGEWAGLAMGLWLCRDAFARHLRARWDALVERAALRGMMAMNADLVVRSLLLQACHTSFVFLSAGQGDVGLAANQVLLQFMFLFAFILDGFALSAEALVGQAVGARAPGHVRRAAVISGQWAFGASLVLTLGVLFGGPHLIAAMTTSEAVRAEAARFLPWIWALPLASFASYVLDGIFIGATLSREMRNAMVQAVLLYGLSLLVFLPLFGPHGLWLAMLALNLGRSLMMARRYPRAEAKAR